MTDVAYFTELETGDLVGECLREEGRRAAVAALEGASSAVLAA